MTPEEFKKLNDQYPYLTYLKFFDQHIIGIIQNVDSQMISIYAFNDIQDQEIKQKFLDLGSIWWDDSNHLIPINIFLRQEFNDFKTILKCYPRKDVEDIKGPILSLEDNFQKRIKRKRVQLIRRNN